MTESQKLMRMLAGVLLERGYTVTWRAMIPEAALVVSIAEGGTRVELMAKVLEDGA
jgi:hypothetical protein